MSDFPNQEIVFVMASSPGAPAPADMGRPDGDRWQLANANRDPAGWSFHWVRFEDPSIVLDFASIGPTDEPVGL